MIQSVRPLPNKILFLDIDGVLNTGNHDGHFFNPVATAQLTKILEQTECGIVMSTSWRLDKSICFPMLFIDYVPLFNRRYLGDTPDLSVPVESSRYSVIQHYSYVERGNEIQKWITDNNYTGKIAILDDNDEMVHLTSNLFLTRFYMGLTEEIADQVIKHLNS